MSGPAQGGTRNGTLRLQEKLAGSKLRLRRAIVFVRRVVGPVRVRLALLVLIAAIPLLVLSATIVWQSYQMALGATDETVIRLLESAIARHASAIGGTEQMMQALAQVAELHGTDHEACRARLRGVLALQLQRYSNIAMFDRDGRLACSAMDIPATLPVAHLEQNNRALMDEAARTGVFALGPVRTSALMGTDIIPVIYPLQKGHGVAGFLYAGLRIDWFAQPAAASTLPAAASALPAAASALPAAASARPAAPSVPDLEAVWLASRGGVLTQVSRTGPSGLPPAPVLDTLLTGSTIIDSPSTGGHIYAYASALLGDGYQVIVATPAAADRRAAHALLAKRIAQLALLLVLGLAAVAIGAHVALVEPLGQLSRAVARWRAGGRFDPSSIDDPPAEVRDLAQSFSSAVEALAAHDARHAVAVEQQDLLMKEIHHRVKNNLQIVASLLNLQASRIRQPEAKAEFASARDRVRALATLHRHLYAEGEVTSINMRSFLKELCGQLFEAMGEREGRRIKLSIEASEIEMSSDQAVPLSLIVTEAVSNALKYAFPAGRHGHVDVRLTTAGQEVELRIRDDGIGIPAGRSETETGTRDGLGLTLIRGFARQLGGTLTVEEEGGTEYRLVMTLRRSGHADAEQPPVGEDAEQEATSLR